jgi:hypothetical protein
METMQAPTRRVSRRAAPRRIRVQIRKISPWSVLKLSLLFYFCVMLVILLGLGMLWAVIDALGILDSAAKFAVSLAMVDPGFRFNGGAIFRTLFFIGVISVVVWSALTVFVVFLYNLISDLVGGIEVTLTERR